MFNNLNPNLTALNPDYLYHLGFNSSMDLIQIFGDVHQVIFTQTSTSAKLIANKLIKYYTQLDNIEAYPIGKQERFHLYKIGNFIVVSHGIGEPSCLICLHEITKLLNYTKNYDVYYYKLNSTETIELPLNTIILSTEVLNSKFEPIFTNIECGKKITYSSILNQNLIKQIIDAQINSTNIVCAKTITAKDTFFGFGHINTIIPLPYTKNERDSYFQKLTKFGIANFDLESGAFAAFTNHMKIPALIISYSISNLSESDETQLSFEKQIDAIKSTSQVLFNFIFRNNNRIEN